MPYKIPCFFLEHPSWTRIGQLVRLKPSHCPIPEWSWAQDGSKKQKISSFVNFKVVFSTKTGKNRKKPGKTGKKRTNRIREVLFHVPKLYWDCIMVFGKRSSCLHGSQWAADSAALPLDVDMAGDVRGWDQNLFFWIQASFYRSERSLITTECWISKLCVFPTTLVNLHEITL